MASLNEINWKPDRKLLEQFSELWMFFFGLVGMPLAWYQGHTRVAAALWVIAIAGRLVGLLRPMWLAPVFVGMSLAAFPIGWVVSHVALAIIYYLVFTPVALVFRIIGRDPLNRALDRQAATYWEAHNPDRGKKRYLRQF